MKTTAEKVAGKRETPYTWIGDVELYCVAWLVASLLCQSSVFACAPLYAGVALKVLPLKGVGPQDGWHIFEELMWITAITLFVIFIPHKFLYNKNINLKKQISKLQSTEKSEEEEAMLEKPDAIVNLEEIAKLNCEMAMFGFVNDGLNAALMVQWDSFLRRAFPTEHMTGIIVYNCVLLLFAIITVSTFKAFEPLGGTLQKGTCAKVTFTFAAFLVQNLPWLMGFGWLALVNQTLETYNPKMSIGWELLQSAMLCVMVFTILLIWFFVNAVLTRNRGIRAVEAAQAESDVPLLNMLFKSDYGVQTNALCQNAMGLLFIFLIQQALTLMLMKNFGFSTEKALLLMGAILIITLFVMHFIESATQFGYCAYKDFVASRFSADAVILVTRTCMYLGGHAIAIVITEFTVRTHARYMLGDAKADADFKALAAHQAEELPEKAAYSVSQVPDLADATSSLKKAFLEQYSVRKLLESPADPGLVTLAQKEHFTTTLSLSLLAAALAVSLAAIGLLYLTSKARSVYLQQKGLWNKDLRERLAEKAPQSLHD